MHVPSRNILLKQLVYATMLCVAALAAGASSVFSREPGDPGAGAGANDDAAFLQRISDRILRAEYQQRFHVVVRDDDFDGGEVQPRSPATHPVEGGGDTIGGGDGAGSRPPLTSVEDSDRVKWIIVGLTLPCGFVVAALLRHRDRRKGSSHGALTGKQKQNRKRTRRT